MSKSGLLALLLLLLILFPSVLFNSTYEEHYEEVRSWFGFGKRAAAGAAAVACEDELGFSQQAWTREFRVGLFLGSFGSRLVRTRQRKADWMCGPGQPNRS